MGKMKDLAIDIENARSFSNQEYWDAVNHIAEECINEVFEFGTDLYDAVHQSLDGHQFIIYYAHHDAVIKHSANSDCWEYWLSREDIAQLVVDQGIDGARSDQAFFAMFEDVNDAVTERAASRGLSLCK